jgi:hypothetical protein
MKPLSRSPRRPFKFSSSINRKLDMYALAATTAGVGVLAAPQAAKARIVYTPAHVQIPINKPFPIDLDHNGKADFVFLNARFSTEQRAQWRILDVCRHVSFRTFSSGSGYVCSVEYGTNADNQVVLDGAHMRDAAALHAGKRIQKGDVFGGTSEGHAFPVAMGAVEQSLSVWNGPWVNGGKGVRDRYLGMKFKVNGRFHFGWARLTVKTYGPNFTATLAGYAYETVPGKGIVAGQTKDDDGSANSLGSLALCRK